MNDEELVDMLRELVDAAISIAYNVEVIADAIREAQGEDEVL